MNNNKKIALLDLEKSEPYKIFSDYFTEAHKCHQKSIDAIAISSLNSSSNEVSSRFVNLKYIIGDEWIFFSNYKSPKAIDFESHDQISALIFWESINIQIRLKAKVFKSSKKISDDHFMKRSKEKNSLAISSSQSQKISSYEEVKEKYFDVFKSKDPLIRPSYWGGYSFRPYEIEFWKGSEFRLNKRDLFTKNNGIWIHQILEP